MRSSPLGELCTAEDGRVNPDLTGLEQVLTRPWRF